MDEISRKEERVLGAVAIVMTMGIAGLLGPILLAVGAR